MNENIKFNMESPEPVEEGRSANPSYYLDRASLTILMLMKLIAGLSKLCIAVSCAFMLNTFVSALNKILKDGSVNGKAMIAQILRTLRFPMENIRQAIAVVPENLIISPRLPLYVFAVFLPFMVISVLEAIALIRLRLGKGGTRTIGIIQWIYFLIDAIKILAFTLLALVVSLLSLIRLGGTPGIMLASVFFSLAVFFIPVRVPAMLYHRNIAGIMKDIRYEMKTGMQGARRWINLNKILGFLIAIEVAGAVISLLAYWRPTKQDPAMATFIMIIVCLAVKLLKYICVMFFYRNFMQLDGIESNSSASHKPQIILVGLVTMIFVFAGAFLCAKSVSVSQAVVERTAVFFNNARQTVEQMSSQADKQINALEQTMDSETGAEGGSQNPQQGTGSNPQQETDENQQQETNSNSKQETDDNPQQKKEEETTGTVADPSTGSQEETE